tara:strand:+ start:24 stop:362 length:339 start_codon:yes stop_codon:yes gene_type:complete
MAQMMIPLILCCAVVSSSSLAMQFMGGMGGGLGGLFDISKLTGTIKKAPPGHACKPLCGDCTQAKYDENHAKMPEQSASNFKAICENNKSAYSGPEADFGGWSRQVGPNCCP